MTKERVAFRVFDEGDVIALMIDDFHPDTPEIIMSYQSIGQHGMAHRDLLDELDKATPEEYADLKDELERIGYEFEVIHD
jgi:hypothetical protein